MANSFQQPVSGEPSLGEGHWRGDSAGGATIFSQNPTVANAWYDVTFSTVPSGTRAAHAVVKLTLLTGVGLRVIYIRKNGDTNTGQELIQGWGDNNEIIIVLGRFPLDANKKAEVACNVAGVLEVYEAVFYDL